MAEGKKTFIFYSDWINIVREMPNEDAGELLKHILSYVNDENPETKNLFVKMAFGHMKPLIKSDLKKWDLIREKRKKAGAKGGKANAKQKQANAKQLEAVNDNVNVDSKLSLYSESDFLSNWKVLRKGYLNKPTNIDKLSTMERSDFNKAVSEFGKEKINIALKGLFKQEVINFGSMTLRPKHFFENVLKYYDAEMAKEYKLYGSKKKEIQY